MKALVLDNVVVQVAEVPFEVHESMNWHDCSSDVRAGWILKNNNFERFVQPITWDDIRVTRNSKLAETDWIVIKSQEQGTSIPIEWSSYRQALRDITSTFSTPESVVWPVKPS